MGRTAEKVEDIEKREHNFIPERASAPTCVRVVNALIAFVRLCPFLSWDVSPEEEDSLLSLLIGCSFVIAVAVTRDHTSILCARARFNILKFSFRARTWRVGRGPSKRQRAGVTG